MKQLQKEYVYVFFALLTTSLSTRLLFRKLLTTYTPNNAKMLKPEHKPGIPDT
ncbi:hypothetical protein APHCR_0021 [Anaplasma phagocytophilum str. CR1007]|nr:hypothetical protein APHCR_0021 [Anaplasma phagocytophilum str. CR1007]